jgi:hypothetical protein
MRILSEFEKRVAAFYAEANRYGDHQAILRAGAVAAVVRDCRPALEDRWSEVRELLGSDAGLQLRLAVIAMRNLIAANRAVLIEPEQSGVVSYTVRVADGVDLLA